MFLMSSNIYIGNFKPIKSNGFEVRKQIGDIFETAQIRIPTKCLYKGGDVFEGISFLSTAQPAIQVPFKAGSQPKQTILTLKANDRFPFMQKQAPKMVEVTSVLKGGMKVKIESGYNRVNKQRFEGFIIRVSHSTPAVIHCEGYGYQLRHVTIGKSYKDASLKTILRDIVFGTDIILSEHIPDVTLVKVMFNNLSGIDALLLLKDKYYISIQLTGKILYAGLKYLKPNATAKLKIGHNTIKTDDFKYEISEDSANVKVRVRVRRMTGKSNVFEAGPKDGRVKQINVGDTLEDSALQELAETEYAKAVNAGYGGKITLFLEPQVEPGMAIKIIDDKYPERNSMFFVDGVETSFSISGGRQKVQLGARIS
jgi:hypothetical protein